jgi:hypothetical protein
MRKGGNEQVGRLFAPEIFKQAHEPAMEGANGRLQQAQEIHAAECPAIPQYPVVHILNANSGELAKNVQRIENFLKIYESDFKGKALALDLNL